MSKQKSKSNNVYNHDYLCTKKCIFQKRIHKEGEVYVFASNVDLPEYFTRIGIHREIESLPEQIKVLKGRIKVLEDQLVKVTAEKDNLQSKRGE